MTTPHTVAIAAEQEDWTGDYRDAYEYLALTEDRPDHDAAFDEERGIALVEMTEEQADAVRAAVAVREGEIAAANAVIAAAEQRKNDARAAYERDHGAWLRGLYHATEAAYNSAEQAAYEAENARLAAEDRAEQAAEDAELGPRDYYRIPVPKDRVPLQDRRTRIYKHLPRYYTLHLVTCSKVTNPDRQRSADDYIVHGESEKRMRRAEATTEYALGMRTCGLCKPEDALIGDGADSDGRAALAERTKRESAPIKVTESMLRDALKAIGLAWSKYGGAGFHQVDVGGFRGTTDTDAVLGWFVPGTKHVSPIPEEHREQVFEHLSGKLWWQVRWTGGSWYLIISVMTKAQRRAAIEADRAAQASVTP